VSWGAFYSDVDDNYNNIIIIITEERIRIISKYFVRHMEAYNLRV
jgi:hypothetical protein